jgi:hypothetical protein
LSCQFIGRQGVVHEIIDDGTISVQYEGFNAVWIFSKSALSKVKVWLCPLALMSNMDAQSSNRHLNQSSRLETASKFQLTWKK